MSEMIGNFTDVDVDVHTPPADAVVVLRFGYYHSTSELKSIFDSARQKFPNNAILVIPKDIDIQELSIEQLVQLRDMVTMVIKAKSDERSLADT